MEKKLIMDDLAIQRSLKRITHEIIEHNKGVDNIIMVGIRSRGVYLARRLAALIRSFEQVEIPVYALDVSFWRDDHKRTQSRSEAIPVQERKVILVDDVLFKDAPSARRWMRSPASAVPERSSLPCSSTAVTVNSPSALIISGRTFPAPCMNRSWSGWRSSITKAPFISHHEPSGLFFISGRHSA